MSKAIKTLKEALSSIDRLFRVIEQKDREIAKLKERIAMLEFARNARMQLERAKPLNDWVH